jgi:penicillin V acylase-like amidase (Ntn superfamily)
MVLDHQTFEGGINMKRVSHIAAGAAAIFISAALFAGTAAACSTFLLRDGTGMVLGKNFDMMVREGMLMTNQRNVTKVALLGPGKNPARWVSKYGSITFNQVGKEYPFGGINEAGLIVEIMWLESTGYPDPDGRAAVPELQWIQYQLDNCASAEEVIATDGSVRIEAMGKPVHFLVADRAGDVATIEFIGGKLVSHRGRTLPIPALTNNTYDESMSFLKEHKGFGGKRPIVTTYESLDRFATVAKMLHKRIRHPQALVSRAFEILDKVAQGEGTVWTIVYDMDKRTIHFKNVTNRSIRTVRLDAFDFDCAVQPRMLDIEAPLTGEVSASFEPYSTDGNRRLVKHTFARYRELEFMNLPENAQEYLARYPEKLECRQGSGI